MHVKIRFFILLAESPDEPLVFPGRIDIPEDPLIPAGKLDPLKQAQHLPEIRRMVLAADMICDMAAKQDRMTSPAFMNGNDKCVRLQHSEQAVENIRLPAEPGSVPA